MKQLKLLKEIEFKSNENGFYSFSTKYGDMIVNEMGKYIIELINANSFADICTKVEGQFSVSSQDATVKTKDFLYELRNVGIVSFIEEDQQDSDIQFAGEKSYKAISEDIICHLKTSNTLYSITYDTKYFNIYLLRTRSFSNKENYFYKQSNGKYSIIGLQNLDASKAPVTICFLKYGDTMNDLYSLFSHLISEMKKLQKFKMRIAVNANSSNLSIVESLLFEFEFEKEGYLKKEDGVNDIIVYGKVL